MAAIAVQKPATFTLEERISASMGCAPYAWKQPGDRIKIVPIVKGRYRVTFFENKLIKGDLAECRHWNIREQKYIAVEETPDGLVLTDLTEKKWVQKPIEPPKSSLVTPKAGSAVLATS